MRRVVRDLTGAPTVQDLQADPGRHPLLVVAGRQCRYTERSARELWHRDRSAQIWAGKLGGAGGRNVWR
ncbi:formin-like protein 6 [Iris pallida]|uniref:Formin-like protein 6 n=1 Tax=Iris pallida TaxID=29817 RepID=A0AAX6GN02_IRIPA|nr:formin-like protein 6 [Iris pallida]